MRSAATPVDDASGLPTSGERFAWVRRTTPRQQFWVCVAAMAAALVLYAAIVIRNFRGPIGDHVESFLYEYLSYYVSKNLTFTPLPHLDLDNDQVFYPFGTSQGLQSFCVERDLLFSLLTSTFGRGPWLQIYYFGGLVIATYGTFGLLRRDYGDRRATVAAILANLFNFYGAQKYPYHFNIACVHWTTLAIVCDFVIATRLVMRRRITVTFLLLRVLLMALAFGLELGHVLGYALTSALATVVFAVALLAYRAYAGRRSPEDTSDLARFVRDAREELGQKRNQGIILALVGALVFVALLEGPLVAQIVAATKRYDFQNVPLGVWWSQPIRLLIPYTPWVHPSQQPRFLRIWEDQAEVGIGSGGAGIFLLALGVIGLLQSRRKLVYVPLVVTFVAYVVSRPTFDLVRWMPWFAFTRVLSRATVVYSAILALLALDVSFTRISMRLRAPMFAGLLAIGLLEVYTLSTIKMAEPAFAFDDEFMAHMKKIESLPGEAVLDFPFCILGGNGDLAYLCPFMERLKSVYALQRFHHKKVIGQYLGRVHPSQTKPFVDEGWPKMWDPDDPDATVADKQMRCLSDAEWDFFEKFFYENDFAGIQLAIDRLPPGCAEQFYARFGAPMGEVTVPKADRLAFIPRDPATFDRVDKEKAKSLRLRVELPSPLELVRRGGQNRFVTTTGFSGWEWIGDAKHPTSQWMWALAPKAEMLIDVTEARSLDVSTVFRSPIEGQTIDWELDGKPIASWTDLGRGEEVGRSFEGVTLQPGLHALSAHFSKGNRGSTRFAPSDPRPMAIMFESLTLRAKPLQN